MVILCLYPPSGQQTNPPAANRRWACLIWFLINKLIKHDHHLRIRGAMVARLTPDQKVACSIHVGFNNTPNHSGSLFFIFFGHATVRHLSLALSLSLSLSLSCVCEEGRASASPAERKACWARQSVSLHGPRRGGSLRRRPPRARCSRTDRGGRAGGAPADGQATSTTHQVACFFFVFCIVLRKGTRRSMLIPKAPNVS
jgi:hypothetical protein